MVHVKTAFSTKMEGDPMYGFYRNPSDIGTFLKTFYEEADVDPQAVQYVEAFGSGLLNLNKKYFAVSVTLMMSCLIFSSLK